MKSKIVLGVLAGIVGVAVAVLAADYRRPANPSVQIGIGGQSSSTAYGSVAIGSSDGAAQVDAPRACQIGTGLNDVADSLKYRDHWILDGDGGIDIRAYGTMAMKYAMWIEDWFEAGGYVANASLVGTNGLPVYGAKFSETAGRGTWLVTVVDGGGDQAETIGIMDDERNGILAMVPNNAAADGINAQMQGESFAIRSGYLSAFATRFLVTSTNVEARIGLHKTGTTAAITTPGTDYIGFYVTNSGLHSVSITFYTAKNSTVLTAVCSTNYPITSFASMSFAVFGTNVVAMFNGTVVTTVPIAGGYVDDDENLSPVMASRDNTTGQGYIKMDYIGTVQER